jgi:hypothetical protein
VGWWGCYNYTMTLPKTATCDACLEVGDPRDLVEIAGDMVCDNCIDAANDHFNMDDANDYGDTAYGDDSWIESRTSITFMGGYDLDADDYGDDDPSPYSGTYSEM